MNVIEIFQERARQHPGSVAIVSGRAGRETTLTFGELDRRSREIARLLLDEGLEPGDGVVVFVPMSPELYAIMAALLRVGMVPIFVEPAAWRNTLDRAVSTLSVRGFIGIPIACAMRFVVPALRRIPKAFVAGAFFPGAVPLHLARTRAPSDRLESVGPDAPAMLTFTSGSTGRPKGILRTHGILAETHRILSTHLALVPGELDVAVLPIVVFTNLGAGVGSLIPDADLSRRGAVDAKRLATQIDAWRPTGLVASPTLVERLADHALVRRDRFDSLRRVFAGGAPVFPRVFDKAAAVAPGALIRALYGASEAEPMAMLDRGDFGVGDRAAMHLGEGLLVGEPIPEVRLRILRDRFGEPRGPWTQADLEAATVPAGEAGEIVVSGKHVVEGYLGGEGDRDLKIRVGAVIWHRTGDAGRLDVQGRLWLLGRCSARVAAGRGTRYPLTVDAALSDNAALARATLIQHGERVLLVVEPRGSPEDETLVEIGRGSAWAGAEELVAIRRFPLDRRHNAKIDYPALRRMLDERRWMLRVPINDAFRLAAQERGSEHG